MSSSWQSGFINTNGLRLHYTRTGGPKPPLVLAHGVTDDGLCWSPVATALAPDYDVIMVDARGHGLSDAPLEGYGPIEQADNLAGLIEALDLTAPLILGHSMGAMTTLMLAARHPELPRAIALEDPPPWWDPRTIGPFTRLAGSNARVDYGAATTIATGANRRAACGNTALVRRRTGTVGRRQAALQPQLLQPAE